EAEAGDGGAEDRVQADRPEGAERQVGERARPHRAPGREDEEGPGLGAVEDEEDAEHRVGSHARADCSPPRVRVVPSTLGLPDGSVPGTCTSMQGPPLPLPKTTDPCS